MKDNFINRGKINKLLHSNAFDNLPKSLKILRLSFT